MKTAALYLRSSKDRSDVSIDAQRRELNELAKSRGFMIVAEHVDVVQSGKDENRQGFQALIRDIKSKDRTWSVIMVLDTSRIARNQYTAHCFRFECQKRNIDMVFAKTPELDGIAGILLPAIMMAMDEVHSFMSREKGLAGMAENVKQGWRAGGRAPFGYSLEYVDTGAVREGQPVQKSRLARNADSEKVAAYLTARLERRPAQETATELGIELSSAALVNLEWNALTYAGHTVWNVHNPRTRDGYRGGTKRRPRGEWLIQYDTHPALITTEVAEELLQRLERGRDRCRRTSSYLLSGILATPSGAGWHGNGGYYRAGPKNISAPKLEQTVLAQLSKDLDSPAFIAALLSRARAAQVPHSSAQELATLERELRAAEGKISRLVDLAAEADEPAPYQAKIKEWQKKVGVLADRKERAAHTAKAVRVLHQVSEDDVRAMLAALSEQVEELDREELQIFLRQILRVELCPDSLDCHLHYAFPITGSELASPRQSPEIPKLLHTCKIKVLPEKRGRKAAA
jgi:site-specific DNA recombinase